MKTAQRRSKINDLHRKIRQVDEAAAKLVKKRAKLLKELNNVEPPISVLPPEVLCVIFSLARPSGFSIQNSLEIALFCDLTRVSKHWRQVLLSNQAIWTEADLGISWAEPRRNANTLLPFIMHSGQLPLSLGIFYFSDVHTDTRTLIHPSVDPLLVKNLGRVTRLRLRGPPLGWFSHHGLFKQLTHLALHGISTTLSSPLSLDQTVSLTVRNSPHIRITSAPLITTLELIYMPISSSFFIINNCPNVQKLYLSSRVKASDPGFPSRPFTLPHLEALHWNIYVHDHDEWYTAILNHIRLPSLQTLEWEEQKNIEHQTKAKANFFRGLPTSLTSLRLLNTWIVPDKCKEDIYPVPPINCHLESIEFIECSIRYFLFFLQKLQTIQLPRLHKIRTARLPWTSDTSALTGEEFTLQMREDVSRACLTMLRNCMNVSDRQFTLVLEEPDMGWWEKVQEGLVEFKPSGCQLKILRTGYTIVLNT